MESWLTMDEVPLVDADVLGADMVDGPAIEDGVDVALVTDWGADAAVEFGTDVSYGGILLLGPMLLVHRKKVSWFGVEEGSGDRRTIIRSDEGV